MPRRHFIQHIGGDPIAIRFVKYDPKTNGPAMRQTEAGWIAEWTENPEERNEWDSVTEAQEAKARLGVGLVLHTPSDEPDPDIDAHRRHQPPPPEIEERPLRDDEIPWWQR